MYIPLRQMLLVYESVSHYHLTSTTPAAYGGVAERGRLLGALVAGGHALEGRGSRYAHRMHPAEASRNVDGCSERSQRGSCALEYRNCQKPYHVHPTEESQRFDGCSGQSARGPTL